MMLPSKYAVCGSHKLRFLNEQEQKGLNGKNQLLDPSLT